MTQTIEITKREAVAFYGGNQAALARALGIGRAAVSKWSDGPIPEAYALKLRYVLLPERFKQTA